MVRDHLVAASKCALFQKRVKFLGSIVSGKGIEPDPEKVQAVEKWPTPQSVTEVRASVALASYYRRHIRSFAETAPPLHKLTKKNMRFSWEEPQETAFNALKQALVSAPIFAMPIDGGGYVLESDANNFSMGCVLQQWQNGELKVIGYASKTLHKGGLASEPGNYRPISLTSVFCKLMERVINRQVLDYLQRPTTWFLSKAVNSD